MDIYAKASQCSLGQTVAGGSIEVATVTDLCNDQDLPEVEIFSLIEEQIPRYRLRADSVIDFTGYSNLDWIQTPVLPSIDDADLTPELVEETLKYFILCADRVTQMTKTYNDIEAVSRLLEEKERDLELAARIGQSLLEKNKGLEENNNRLEELISQANERINQLRHDLAMKDELLQLYSQNYDNTDANSTDSTDGLTGSTLQKKIKTLEEENLNLQLETANLKLATDGWEDKEQKLVSDCVQQLDDLHQQLAQFAKELAEKTEECSLQKDEISNLLHQIVALQKCIHSLTVENMEYHKTLEASHDSQNNLAREIADLKDKNAEILSLLKETQDELHCLHSQERPRAMHHSYMSSFLSLSVSGDDSLATELETSLRSEIDYPKGYSPRERKKHAWKIFETAKAVKAVCSSHDASSCSASLLGTCGFESEDLKSVSQRSSVYFSDAESGASEGYGGDIESLYGNTLGKPGIPGSSDLQVALCRLMLRRANELNELDYAEEEKARQERDSRNCDRTVSDATDVSYTEPQTPKRSQSPDSMLSANSGYISLIGNQYRMPEKLKIVKPLEGSLTLLQWQKLATPHIGVIFESSPGVHSRGETKLDIVPEMHNLSDYEEDDDIRPFPTRCPESASVYTLTDSRVIHPTETTSDQQCHGHGTSTYSMSLGLASLLNERDVVQTPSEGAGAQIRCTHNSNPARFPSLISEIQYKVSESSTTSASLPVPRDENQLIPPLSSLSPMHPLVDTQGLVSLPVSQNPSQDYQENPANDNYSGAKNSTTGSVKSNTISVINKLKERGSGLFGYLMTGMGVYNTGFATKVGLSQSCVLPQTTASASVPNVNTSASNNTSAITTTAINTDCTMTVTTTQYHMPKQPNFAYLLSRKAAEGIIGVLSKLTRDGNL